MLNPPRFLTPFYFSARYWAARTAGSPYIPAYVGRWGGQYFGAPYFEDPYFIRRNPNALVYTPQNLEKWGGDYFGSGYFEDHYFVTGEYLKISDARYWPQWTYARHPSSGLSVLGELLWAQSASSAEDEIPELIKAETSALYDYLGEAKEEFVLDTGFRSTEVRTMDVTFSSYTVAPLLTRNPHEYYSWPGPVALVSDYIIKIRNLAFVAAELFASPSGIVTLPATPHEDSNIWVDLFNDLHLVPALFSLGGQVSSLSVTPGIGVSVTYEDPTAAAALLGTITCTVNSGPTSHPKRKLLLNSIDKLASVFGLYRLEDETNYELRARINHRSAFLRLEENRQYTAQIGVDLGLSSSTAWNTSGNLTLPSGYVEVVANIREYTDAWFHGTFLGYTSIGLGVTPDLAYAEVRGRVAPIAAVSGIVSTPASLDGLDVNLRVFNYTRGASGLLLNRNTPVGDYTVTYSSGVGAHFLFDYTDTTLFTPAGAPTNVLLTATDLVSLKSRCSYGFGSWGGLKWITEDEARPGLDYLPEDVE